MFGFLVGGGLYLLYLVRGILDPFVWGALIAYLMVRPVMFLEQKGFTRTAAIVLVLLMVTVIILLVGWLLLPAFLREITSLSEQLPLYLGGSRDWFLEIQHRYRQVYLPETVRQALDDAMVNLQIAVEDYLRGVLAGMIKGCSDFFTLIFAPILAFYFLRDLEGIKRALVFILPPRWRNDVLALLGEIDVVLISFIKGNLLVCFIVGALAAVTLSVLGVNFALTLGVIIGISDLVPYLGPVIGGIPAVAIAWTQSPRLAFYVIVLIFLIHQVEGSIIAPKILGDSVGLNPLLVIFALLAGGELWGGWGLLVAVPLAAVLKVVIRFTYYKWLDA